MSLPVLPHLRMDRVSFEDRDNFIRNLVTILLSGGWVQWPVGVSSVPRATPAPLTPSASGKAALLDLPTIKLYCRVDNEVEDDLLKNLEMAARLHTENLLERPLEEPLGENLKQALLMLIAHWYRNREAVVVGTITNITPLAYQSLVFPEKNFRTY